MSQAILALCVLAAVLASQHHCPHPEWERRSSSDLLFAEREPEDNGYMPNLANGYIGLVIGNDTIYLAGVFNGKAETSTHRASIPSPFTFTLAGLTPCACALDLKNAAYYRRFVDGDVVIDQRVYASRHDRHVLVNELSIDNGSNDQFVLNFEVAKPVHSQDIAFSDVSSEPCNLSIGRTMEEEQAGSGRPTVAVCASAVPSSAVIPAKEKRSLRFLAAFATDLPEESNDSAPGDAVVEYYTQAFDASSESMWSQHVAAWADLWASGMAVAEVGVAGHHSDNSSLGIAATINSSLYYLLSNVRGDWPFGLSPGGIATNAYNGHSFWDCETWMYPTVLLLYPQLAASLLEYRIARLPAAQAKAAAAGWKGAWFPWESAYTGSETTPPPNMEGFWEIHIDGDVLVALRQYWYTTGDRQWLETKAWPVIENIAQFWASRAKWSNERNCYVLDGVQPPDESAGKVNNSVFTNAVASLSFEFAIEAADVLGKAIPRDTWQEIASKLAMPFDKSGQHHLEFDGFKPKLINQADVALMQYPLLMHFGRQIDYNDIAYYENITDPDGYFTGDSAYSIAWLALGEREKGDEQFDKSFLHMQPPFNVWKERVSGGHLNFITGAGGYLQNVLFGYCGVRVNSTALSLSPLLPPRTSAVTVTRLSYRGHRLSLSYSADTLSLWADDSDPAGLVLVDAAGVVHPITPAPGVVLPRGDVVVQIRSGPWRPLERP